MPTCVPSSRAGGSGTAPRFGVVPYSWQCVSEATAVSVGTVPNKSVNWKPCSVICQISNKLISSPRGVLSLRHVKKSREIREKGRKIKVFNSKRLLPRSTT